MALIGVNSPGNRTRPISKMENIAMGVDMASKILGQGLDAYKIFAVEKPQLKLKQEELDINKRAKEQDTLKDLLVGGAKEVPVGTPGAMIIGGKSYLKSPSESAGLDDDIVKQWSGKGYGIVSKAGKAKPGEIDVYLPRSGASVVMKKLTSSDQELTGKDRFDMEKDLRKEFDDKAEMFQNIHDNTKTVMDTFRNSDIAGVGDPGKDITLVKTFERLLDPKGSVREGDVQLINSQAPLWEEVKRLYDQKTGKMVGALPPSLRKSLLDQVQLMYQSRRESMLWFADQMKNKASRYNLDPSNIVTIRPELQGLDTGAGASTGKPWEKYQNAPTR